MVGKVIDVPMALQDNVPGDLSANNVKYPCFLEFGSFSSNEKYIKKVEEIFTIGGFSSELGFGGFDMVKKNQKDKLMRYIKIGSITIGMEEAGG